MSLIDCPGKQCQLHVQVDTKHLSHLNGRFGRYFRVNGIALTFRQDNISPLSTLSNANYYQIVICFLFLLLNSQITHLTVDTGVIGC